MSTKRDTIDELFTPDVRWIAVMDNRDCDTGLMAFSYPEDGFGYNACKIIDLEEIPDIVKACEKRGFQLIKMSQSEYGTKTFTYQSSHAAWWTDFEFGTKFND